MARSLRRPIFIAGPGRSGTTLLRSILSAHPRIGVAPEMHFLKQVPENGKGEAASQGKVDELWEWYTSTRHFRDLGVKVEDCRRILDESGDSTFRGMFAAMLLAYGDRTGKSRVGEKTPSNIHFVEKLLDWFPDARILVLRRDPRAVVASQLRSVWVKQRLTPLSFRHGLLVGKRIHQVAFYAEDWSEIFERILPQWRSEERVRVVSYETLVTNPEREVREICEFLGEAFDPGMLGERAREATLPAAPPSDPEWRQWVEEHHERSRSRISSDSLGKWRDQLADVEVGMIEGRCEQGMREAGYSFCARRVQRWIGRIRCRSLLEAERLERRGRAMVGGALRLASRLWNGILFSKKKGVTEKAVRG